MPAPRSFRFAMLVGLTLAGPSFAAEPQEERPASPFLTGDFRWTVGEPVLAINQDRLPAVAGHRWVSVKDPSVVRHDGRWHLFCTLRNIKEGKGNGQVRIGYLSFETWADAPSADWALLDLTTGYHGAPQVLYFAPQKKWYLIYQALDESRDLLYGPCYSVADRVDDPTAWTKPEPLYIVPEETRKLGEMKAGIDFWLICDDEKAYLFYTTLDGRMRRAETALANFPDQGWSQPVVALKADVFEASHTYRLKGDGRYLTMIEAQKNRRRYFKAYVADRLDGPWIGLADSLQRPLVSTANVVNQPESWATSYSHGEFIRDGVDQRLIVDPSATRILFQGVDDAGYRVGNYRQIPWRLGLLEPAPARSTERLGADD